MMNHVRGVLMLIAGCFALYRGWQIHTGPYSVAGYALGVVALGLGAWHLTRKQQPRVR